MDPYSGAIFAMANSPTFNPNEYADSPVSSWINHSLSLTYEPGSTFKMVTVAAALEEGLITPDEVFYCENGSIVVSGRRIRDHKPYGNLTVSEIVQNSSNVGTIKIAQRVGPDKLKAYIDRYGFGEKTSVDLPAEVGGLVRDVSQWSKTSYASIAIGQELSVTPLQIASMVSTIANGGIRYKPYVVQKIQDPNGGTIEIKPSGTRVMSQNTAQQLHDMLEDVVTDGTAKTSQLEGYRAAGKTGTAQKVDPETRRYSHSKYVASFAGFAPVSNPRLAIVVVVDEPRGLYYGGEVAAPVFKRIAEQVLRLKSVVPDVPLYAPHYAITPNKTKNKPTPRPNKDPFKGPDASLVSSKEGAGFQDGPITVPDVIGQPLLKASDTIDRLGLASASVGDGKVIWQDPPAGVHVRPGTRVQLRLSLR
jgi:cell division protein FtsI (penicillin-binding protein 3)